MKRKLFKTTLALLAVFSLFLLFSCGKGDDDKLKSDAFEQFNESVDTLGASLSGGTSMPEMNYNSLLNYDFSIDDMNIKEIFGFEIGSIAVKDGMMFLQGLDAPGFSKFKNYAAKIYDGEIVLFELLGDGVNESAIPIESAGAMPNIEKFPDLFAAFRIDEDDIDQMHEKGKFVLEEEYLEGIIDACYDAGLPELGELFNTYEDVTISVDTTRYKKSGRIVFTIYVGDEENTLTVRIKKEDGIHTFRMTLENEDAEEEYEIALKTKEGALVELMLNAGTHEDYLMFKLGYEPGTSKDGIEKTQVNIDAALVAPESKFTIDGSADVYADKDGNLTKIDASASAKINGAELLSASLSYDTERFSRVGKEGVVMLIEVNAEALGGGVMPLSTKIGSSSKVDIDLRVKTVEYNEEKKNYELSLEISGGGMSMMGWGTINFPAKNVPTLTEAEKAGIKNRDNLSGKGSAITSRAMELNELAQTAARNGSFKPEYYGGRIYTEEKGVYYFTDVKKVNGLYQTNTRAIEDYSRYIPLYSKNKSDFRSIEDSPAIVAVREIINQTDPDIGALYESRTENFMSFYYLEEFGCYAVMDRHLFFGVQFVFEKPTAEDYPNTVLHEVRKTDTGYEVHNYQTRYDEKCYLYYECVDCASYKKSWDEKHGYKEAERITEPKDENYTLSICERCRSLVMKITDGDSLVTVNLLPVGRIDMTELDEIPEMSGYTIANPENCFFLTKIVCETDAAKPQTVEIPQLEEAYGYKIIGVEMLSCSEANLYGSKLVLPDGVELLMSASFHYAHVSELGLPDSVVYIGPDAFSSSSVRELVIPQNTVYVHHDAFDGMNYLTRMVVNAVALDTLPHIDAKNLEELVFNLPVKNFKGFNDCKITEFEIPEGVESVGGFSGNETLTKIVFSSTVREIENIAFSGCSELYEVVLNTGLKRIGRDAFGFCQALSIVRTVDGEGTAGTVVFPEGLEKIEARAFEFCNNIKNLVFPASLINLDVSAFEYGWYDTVVFKGEYSFGFIPNFNSDEITYLGEITSEITFGKVTNIYTTELPEAADGVTYKVPATAEKINFAGSELEFALAGYVLERGKTVANYEVAFENKEE